MCKRRTPHADHTGTKSRYEGSERSPAQKPNCVVTKVLAPLPPHLHVQGTTKGFQNVCTELAYCGTSAAANLLLPAEELSKLPPLQLAGACLAVAALPQMPGRLSGMALRLLDMLLARERTLRPDPV